MRSDRLIVVFFFFLDCFLEIVALIILTKEAICLKIKI